MDLLNMTSLLFTFWTLTIFAAIDGGRSLEHRRHQNVCPCIACTRYRKIRDAEAECRKEEFAAKEPEV